MFKKFNTWLDQKLKIHNDKITYVDQEECWVKSNFLTSVIVSFIISFGLIGFGLYKQIPGLSILGIVYIVIMTIWHYWHLCIY